VADLALLIGAPCTLTDTDPCDNYPGMVEVACGEPSIALLTFICVHEHMDRALSCAGCAAELQRVADVLVCPSCEDGPLPHECRSVMSIEWLEESHG
jgi:hypothetical protein